MSPVSRRRKSKRGKKSVARTSPAAGLDLPVECHCPVCSGADFDPRQAIDEMLATGADALTAEDLLDAELIGATFLSMGLGAVDYEEMLVGGLIPQFESRASAEALALLLSMGSVAQGRVAEAALAAVERLTEAGIPRPVWAAELDEPITVSGCLRLCDTEETGSILACSFHRGGRSHAFLIWVNHRGCHAAENILLLDGEQLPEALDELRTTEHAGDVKLTTEMLDTAEFRWQVERALEARAVHDGEAADWAMSEDEAADLLEDGDGPPYPLLAVLLRARLSGLPVSDKPAAPHGGSGHSGVPIPDLGVFARLVAGTNDKSLPPKRSRSDAPAPVYQVKVELRDARPRIWRRLQVPADISLADLHRVIQVAFDWDDSHLHVFETPYGRFGSADFDLEHRAETPVSLEQVAPEVNSKLSYTYDFGDSWEHTIVVEKVLARDEKAVYPRCTGGRRAAPPEDCGGIWGYAELLDILNDPGDPEHRDRLEWLGLDDAADFDPDSFEAEAITRALATLP